MAHINPNAEQILKDMTDEDIATGITALKGFFPPDDAIAIAARMTLDEAARRIKEKE